MNAHFNLGLEYFLLNKLEEAYKEFKIVLDANPNDREVKAYMRRIALSLNFQP
jgi:tetratricopeptide (TPR) repeat protein